MAGETNFALLLRSHKSRSCVVGCVLSMGRIKCSMMLRFDNGGGNSVHGWNARNKIHEG